MCGGDKSGSAEATARSAALHVRRARRVGSGRMRLLPVVIAVIALLIAVADVVPFGRIVVPILEARFPRADVSQVADIDGIIALGGDWDRITAAAEIARRHPHALIVVIGEEHARARRLIEAVIGDPGRAIIEPTSRSTAEDGAAAKRLLQPTRVQRVLLVTSPAHMPRAVGVFRKAGFTVLPWPVSRAVDRYRLTNRIAMHECLGLIGYRMLGYTADWFPAPD